MKDKHILVTGATSGIGKSTAILLSRQGARVAIAGRREERLKETLAAMEGEGHSMHVLDVSMLDELEGRVKEMVSRHGKFDGYVHSAGTVNNLPLKNYTPARLDQIMRTNFSSYFEMVRV